MLERLRFEVDPKFLEILVALIQVLTKARFQNKLSIIFRKDVMVSICIAEKYISSFYGVGYTVAPKLGIVSRIEEVK